MIRTEKLENQNPKSKIQDNKSAINLLCVLYIASCVLIFAFSLSVYGDSGDGGDAGAFLKNGIGVRPISMGKAFVAVADDVHAGYWNPAGLATLNTTQVSAMYSNPMNYNLMGNAGVGDIGYHTFSLAYPTNFGSLGLSAAYLDVGSIYVVEDASGPTGETFSDKEYGVIASYGSSITDQIHLGVNLKFVRQSIMDNTGSGMGMDLGVLYQPLSLYNLTLGLVIQDLIEPKIKLLGDDEIYLEDDGAYTIPRKVRLGAAYELMDERVLLAVGIDKASGRSAKLHLGTEVEPMKDLDLRLGYTTDTGEITAGVGVRVSVIQLDYGFGFLNLGSTHRVSLTVDFSRLTNQGAQ